jgi:hypothetical protein
MLENIVTNWPRRAKGPAAGTNVATADRRASFEEQDGVCKETQMPRLFRPEGCVYPRAKSGRLPSHSLAGCPKFGVCDQAGGVVRICASTCVVRYNDIQVV